LAAVAVGPKAGVARGWAHVAGRDRDVRLAAAGTVRAVRVVRETARNGRATTVDPVARGQGRVAVMTVEDGLIAGNAVRHRCRCRS